VVSLAKHEITTYNETVGFGCFALLKYGFLYRPRVKYLVFPAKFARKSGRRLDTIPSADKIAVSVSSAWQVDAFGLGYGVLGRFARGEVPLEGFMPHAI